MMSVPGQAIRLDDLKQSLMKGEYLWEYFVVAPTIFEF